MNYKIANITKNQFSLYPKKYIFFLYEQVLNLKNILKFFIILILIIFLNTSLSYAIQAQKDENIESDNLDSEDVIIVTANKFSTWSNIDRQTENIIYSSGSFGDPLLSILSLPGLTESGGAFTLPTVRGFPSEHNKYLIDGIPHEYAYNLLGFSSFSNDVIRTLDLISSGHQVNIDGGIGGVFDFNLRRARKSEDLLGYISLNSLRSELFLEKSIADNVSFYANMRQTMIHLYFKNIGDFENDFELPHATDYMLRLSADLPNNLFFDYTTSGVFDYFDQEFSADSYDAKRLVGLDGATYNDNKYFSNIAALTYAPDNSQSLKLALGYTIHDFKGGIGLNEIPNFETDSLGEGNRSELTLKADYSKILDIHKLSIGAKYSVDSIKYKMRGPLRYCSLDMPQCIFLTKRVFNIDEKIEINNIYAYIQDDITLGKFSQTIGLNYYNNDYLNEQDSEVRLRSTYEITPTHLLYLNYGQYHQDPSKGMTTGPNPVTIKNFPLRSPRNILILPSIGNPDLKFVKSNSISAGWESRYLDNIKLGIEIYKTEFKDDISTNYQSANLFENYYDGVNSGIEVFLQRERDYDNIFDGWISITMADAKRSHNGGPESNFRGALPFMVNLIANFRVNDEYSFGTKIVYNEGLYYTAIDKVTYDKNGNIELLFDDINNDRLPSYFRLDFNFEKRFTKGRFKNFSFNIDALNLLGTRNVLAYELGDQFFPGLTSSDLMPGDVYNLQASDFSEVEGLSKYIGFGIKYRF